MEEDEIMKKRLRKIYIWFRVELRLLRLLFLRVEVPEDAMTSEEMLRAIKEKSKLT